MHKTWKKTMAGALSVCLLAGGIPGASEIGGIVHTITVQAETTDNVLSGECGAYANYTYNPETKTLTVSGSGIMSDGVEDDVAYHNFWNTDPDRKKIMQEMEKVVIGDEITQIGDGAFVNCKSLKEVELGANVKRIGICAFYGCNQLKKINWTDKIEKMEYYSFYSCENLEELYIGEAVKNIDDAAFIGCSNLKQIQVHAANQNFSVQGNSLMNKAQTKWILGCFAADTTCHIYGNITSLNTNVITDGKIENFEVDSQNTKYSSENGLLYSKDGKTLYLCPRGKKGTATVSENATKVGKLGSYAAFSNCNELEAIVIGKNVKDLNYNFSGCSKLKKVEVNEENNYYTADSKAIFSKDKKKLICCILAENGTYTVPKKVTEIANRAFKYCNGLKHVVLSDNVKSVSVETIGDAQIESITLGKNFYNKGKVAWAAKLESLKNIYVSKNNSYYTSVNGVLYNKKKTKLLVYPRAKSTTVFKMPNTVTSLGQHAFNYDYDNIKELYVSNGIKDMTKFELYKFGKLEVLHIGKNVNKIKLESLAGLKKIKVDSKNKNYKSKAGILYTKNGKRLVWCPEGKSGKVTISKGTTTIGGSAFSNCEKVTDIVIPTSVKKIEKYAFSGAGSSETTNKKLVFWVPAGKKKFYKSLLTKKTGFKSGMVIKELEQ